MKLSGVPFFKTRAKTLVHVPVLVLKSKVLYLYIFSWIINFQFLEVKKIEKLYVDRPKRVLAEISRADWLAKCFAKMACQTTKKHRVITTPYCLLWLF